MNGVISLDNNELCDGVFYCSKISSAECAMRNLWFLGITASDWLMLEQLNEDPNVYMRVGSVAVGSKPWFHVSEARGITIISRRWFSS